MDSKTYNLILKTVLYADIFNYPLKEEEVYRWTKDIKILRYDDIKRANGVIIHKNSFMLLKGREELIIKRMEREVISKRKIQTAKNLVNFLKFIPTIKLIGVSGSVAAGNADSADDIDLFIITKRGTLWLTRLLTTIVVELMSRRRRPNETDVADKICLNMFVDERFLAVLRKKQNLYTAHEVCQLKALYDKDGTYQKFLWANRWVRKFLPNGIDTRILGYYDIKRKKEKTPNILISQLLNILNLITKHLQLWYMRRHRTSEIIADGYLAFHPKDHTADVLAAFEKRVNKYAAKI
ncbi:hypothetical protein HYT17_01655 [Candidatus Microgenomates bacterium]|nr:hypothetical protein [Candidatus Microgenomates bacterium]